MGGFVKRYWWISNLVVLAVLAWLSARVANNVVAAEIESLETHPAEPEKAAKATRANKNQSGEMMENIVNRNLFNSEPPEEDDGEGEGEGDLKPGDDIPGEYDDCAESKKPYMLVATLVAEPAAESAAIFRVGGNGLLARPGQKVEDVTVAAIYRERAVFAVGSDYECVALGVKVSGPARPSRGPAAAAPPPRAGGGGRPSDEATIRAGVRDVAENRKEVDRGMLDEQLADLNRLSREARVTAHYKNGRQDGFKVTRVKPGSLYDVLGLKRGDVIKGVNGDELDSPNKALKLLEGLQSARDVTVQVERRGRPMDMEFNIR